MCLGRSRTTTLDVTVNASERGLADPRCTCGKDKRKRLVPNERNPCGRHFVFESLATPVHSNRIHTLNIDFHFPRNLPPSEETTELSLGSCRFFDLSFPQLTNLGWDGPSSKYPIHLFTNLPFTPTVRYLSFAGSWDGLFAQVKNLTSLAFANYDDRVCVETFRLLLLNNRSLQSLSLDIVPFDGNTRGPPVDLLNLHSFRVGFCPSVLSTIIRVPAIRHLSSIRTSYGRAVDETIRLLATGGGIALDVVTFLHDMPEVWEDIVGYARPTIRHVHLRGFPEGSSDASVIDGRAVFPLLADAHTLEVGRGYLMHWYGDFLGDLMQLGPDLKTTRFEVWEEMDPLVERSDGDEMYGHDLLDGIEELVRYRFENHRPFSVVERMVVSESEQNNRQQGYVWRCFYNDRKLGQYVRPV